MSKSINILDKEYQEWVEALAARYRSSQIKAAVKVNSEKLFFNWFLWRDLVEMHVEERWGESVIMQLSKDLRLALPGVDGLSKSNIYYCKKFYQLYNQAGTVFQQTVGKIGMELCCIGEPYRKTRRRQPYNRITYLQKQGQTISSIRTGVK